MSNQTCRIFKNDEEFDIWVSVQSIVPFAVTWYGLHAEHVLVLVYFWESVKGLINYCWSDSNRPDWLTDWLYTDDPASHIVTNPLLGLLGVTVAFLIKIWFGSARGDERTYTWKGKADLLLYVIPVFFLVTNSVENDFHNALPGAYLLLFILTQYGYVPWREILVATLYICLVFYLVAHITTFNSFILSLLIHMTMILTLVGFVLIAGDMSYARYWLWGPP
jgi:hypothetical protein